ncbi:MAG: hypothetical protein KGQ58_07165 [Proteobacteria bacterium]|nr:hypothetical protein [Pseudomonadota bacterium]MDE3207614.1 hypothetical protein [Pseudomonadota bacterium]
MSEIFVFGSNLAGRHFAGASRYAVEHHGAIEGRAAGLQGNSYAIPTKDEDIITLPIGHIKSYVDEFIRFSRTHPELSFYVTRVGCGQAGYTDRDIAPLFQMAPENCKLPAGWRKITLTGEVSQHGIAIEMSAFLDTLSIEVLDDMSLAAGARNYRQIIVPRKRAVAVAMADLLLKTVDSSLADLMSFINDSCKAQTGAVTEEHIQHSLHAFQEGRFYLRNVNGGYLHDSSPSSKKHAKPVFGDKPAAMKFVGAAMARDALKKLAEDFPEYAGKLDIEPVHFS